MPCSTSAAERPGRAAPVGRWLRRVVAAALLWLPLVATAAIEIRSPELIAVDEGHAVAADVEIELGKHLEEAVLRGVVLTFRADFELLRPRWYWFDEKVISRVQTWQLSYHALTRRYRLSTGALHQSFGSLADALRVMSRLRRWTVIERGRLSPGTGYRAALRFQLDTTQLPKPFQLAALGNRDWELASEWVTWAVELAEPATSAASAGAPAAVPAAAPVAPADPNLPPAAPAPTPTTGGEGGK